MSDIADLEKEINDALHIGSEPDIIRKLDGDAAYQHYFDLGIASFAEYKRIVTELQTRIHDLEQALAASSSREQRLQDALEPFARQMVFFKELANAQGRREPTHLIGQPLSNFQHTSLEKARNPINALKVRDFEQAASALEDGAKPEGA